MVDALKSHGHILVVKGGATPLAREIEELMAPRLEEIAPRLAPRAIVGGEVTSTFGDEAIDESVEEMVLHLTRSLIRLDHVEDVFAEDNVIRRDIFRVVRDGLLHPAVAGADEEEEDATVTVRLDTLGYIAATVSKLADAKMLREALERAASITEVRFTAYAPEAREATFRLSGDSPDERLELEEAVADELAELVDQGLVELPTIERMVDVGRPVSAPAEQRAARGRIQGPRAADPAPHRLRRRVGAHVPPVHADEVDRAVAAEGDQIGEGRAIGTRVNSASRHLARGHGELAMADLAEPAHVAFDRDIVGRVGEDHLGLLAVHQGGDHVGIERIAADQPMRPKPPDVAWPAACRDRLRIRKPVIGGIARLFRRKPVDQADRSRRSRSR